MNERAYQCQSCGGSGMSEGILGLVCRESLQGWQFIHFNNDAFRKPTIVCRSCFAGFDIASLSSKIKRVPEHKVERLMAEAIFLANSATANRTIYRSDEQLTLAIERYMGLND